MCFKPRRFQKAACCKWPRPPLPSQRIAGAALAPHTTWQAPLTSTERRIRDRELSHLNRTTPRLQGCALLRLSRSAEQAVQPVPHIHLASPPEPTRGHAQLCHAGPEQRGLTKTSSTRSPLNNAVAVEGTGRARPCAKPMGGERQHPPSFPLSIAQSPGARDARWPRFPSMRSAQQLPILATSAQTPYHTLPQSTYYPSGTTITPW